MKGNTKPVALTVSGFDPGSGAGLAADLKTFASLGVYGTGLITALTSQNHDSFSRIDPVDPGLFSDQLRMITKGYRIRAVKTGLLTNETAGILGNWKRENPSVFLVCDPVFTATSGSDFFGTDDARYLENALFQYADLITPNLHEASLLTGRLVNTVRDMEEAGEQLKENSERSVLLKGGHLEGDPVDLLFSERGITRLNGTRVSGVNTHGSGCILSALVTALIAKGELPDKAVVGAREYINNLMENPVQIDGVGLALDPFVGRK